MSGADGVVLMVIFMGGLISLPILLVLALLVIGGASLWRQGARGMTAQILNPVHSH